MTHKTTMPEPVERVVLRDDGPHLVYEHQVFSTDKRLITADQAEAYKDACVRQGLEDAAMILKANAEACHSDTRIMLRANAEAIRALIPK